MTVITIVVVELGKELKRGREHLKIRGRIETIQPITLFRSEKYSEVMKTEWICSQSDFKESPLSIAGVTKNSQRVK